MTFDDIVSFDVKALGQSAEQVCTAPEKRGVLCEAGAQKYGVRMVTRRIPGSLPP